MKVKFSLETTSCDEEVRKGPINEGAFKQWSKGSEGMSHIKSYRGEEHSKQISKCRGPQVEVSLPCSRNIEELI